MQRSLGIRVPFYLVLVVFIGCKDTPRNPVSQGPTTPGTQAQDVLTYHNDNARTGQQLNETTLTPANINASTFGKLFVISVDGKVDAQPLYAASLSFGNKNNDCWLWPPSTTASMHSMPIQVRLSGTSPCWLLARPLLTTMAASR